MKIFFDHQAFVGAKYGGIARYFFELMKAMSHRQEVDFELSVKITNNEYLKGSPFGKSLRYDAFSNNLRLNQILSVVNRIYSIARLRKQNFDIFHPTYYHTYFLNHIGSKPMVLTFHDVLSEKYKTRFPVLGEGLTEVKQKLLHRADAVIAISEATKRGILEYFEVDESKIKVIPLGNYFSGLEGVVQPNLQLPPRYVLFVGKREYYKNFERFFEAMVPVLKKDDTLSLVCGGGGGFTEQEKYMFCSNGLEKQIVYQSIFDDTTLRQLYANAQAFVFPSLMEGFGLPILEAMSSNCPVIATKGTSFDEIAADAAVYFEAENSESIREAIERVIYDAELQTQMRQKGAQRVPIFKPETTLLKTLEVYQNLTV
ncbi:MAG: glycosyltransferase family 4 protein [Runella sp.]